uniref:Uncharacterized protein n=1 Tax=Amphimedon queenslandica TaxID=400682 RepID=A0A1X7SZE1_AMPQE
MMLAHFLYRSLGQELSQSSTSQRHSDL